MEQYMENESVSVNNYMNSWIMSAPKKLWIYGGADGCLRTQRPASACPRTAHRTCHLLAWFCLPKDCTEDLSLVGLFLPAQGLHGGLVSLLFCLPKDCSEDLAACFCLPKNCMLGGALMRWPSQNQNGTPLCDAVWPPDSKNTHIFGALQRS